MSPVFIKSQKANALLLGLGVAVCYFALAKFGLAFATLNDNVSPIWPATGFAIASVILWGNHLGWFVAVAAFVANLSIPSPAPLALAIGVGNGLEAVIGAMVFRRIMSMANGLPYQRATVATIAASVVGSIVSATIGVQSLHIAGAFDVAAVLQNWTTWMSGDCLGGLIVIPAMLAFAGKVFVLERSKLVRILPLAVFVAGSILTVLVMHVHQVYSLIFVPYAVVLALIALDSVRMALVFVIAVTLLAVNLTFNGGGPFHHGSVNQNLLHIQLYLAGLSATSMATCGLRFAGSLRLPGLLMMVTWIAGGLLSHSLRLQNEEVDARHLRGLIEEAESRVRERMNHYVDSLAGGVGLFEASISVSQDEWRAFAERLNLAKRFPGIQGIGAIASVPAEQLAVFLAERRAEDSNFTHRLVPGHSVPPGTNHFIIYYLEPIEGNQLARGLDLASEPMRRQAAELARDSGEATMSGPIVLVQDVTSYGFVVLYPLYQRGVNGTSTLERQRSIRGWVYAPFVSRNFFSAALGENSELLVSIRDVERDDVGPIYATALPEERRRPVAASTRLQLAQRALTVDWWRGPKFASSVDSRYAWSMGIAAMMALLLATVIANLQSVSERANMLAEQRMRALEEQRALAINASRLTALGVMAGGVAHEINSPLAIIQGKAARLKRSIDSGSGDVLGLKRDIGVIEDTVERIAKIVRGLRAFARNGDSQPMASSPLRSIIEDTLSLCTERFKSHGVQLTVSDIPELTIKCRPIQIAQVLLNLLNNSYDAIESQDQQWIRIDFAVARDKLSILVSDSGSGIPKEVSQKIMEPFFTTKDIGKGTGLGLSISKGIIEDHGGTISLDQDAGHTTFIIELPIDRHWQFGDRATS